jgi:hypothetical protein
MTTIVTRLYDSAEKAHAAASALTDMGLPDSTIRIIGQGDGAEAQMIAARVGKESAAIYANHLSGGKTLLVVQAPFAPIGMAKSVMVVSDRFGPIPVAGVNANEYIREKPQTEKFLSILKDHRRFMSSDMDPGHPRERGTVSSAFGLRTLSQHRTKRSAISGGAFMSTKFLPFPLLSQSKTKTSAGSGRTISSMLGLSTIARRS